MKYIKVLSLALLVGTLRSAPLPAAGYDVVDLGLLPSFNSMLGPSDTMGIGIDNAGQATGTGDIYVNNVSVSHGFFWQSGNLADMDSPSSMANTFVHGMGPGGQVLGENGTGFAFEWISGSGFTLLPIPSGKNNAAAYDMNTTGDIVGSSSNNSGTLTNGTVWKSGGGTTLLAPVNSLFFSSASAINGARTIAGISYNNINQQASVWTFNSGTGQWSGQALGTLGGADSSARDINSAGNVVGDSTRALGQGQGAFIWHPGDAAPIDLDPTRAFGINTFAHGINSNNEVVGSIGGSGAFVWDQARGIRDLQTLVDPNSLFTLTDAADVNDSGWIIGTATDSTDGLSHAVILKPTFLLGDINRDGHVDAADISALQSALADLNNYQATHGPGGGALTNTQLLQIADLSGDNKVNNADLQALINYLADNAGTLPSPGGGGSLTAVPEPSGLALAALATISAIALGGDRKRAGL
jgi:hypothetical protein